jgi:hypothetical protein
MIETLLTEALGSAPSAPDLKRTIALATQALDGLDRCRPLIDFDDEIAGFEATLEALGDDPEEKA